MRFGGLWVSLRCLWSIQMCGSCPCCRWGPTATAVFFPRVLTHPNHAHFSFAGEVACTGLHGANRLASTSLLEGLVWGCSIADHLADRGNKDSKDGLAASVDMGALAPPRVPGTAAGGGGPVASAKALSSAWKDLRCVCVCFYY